MFCPNCGFKVQEYGSFCIQCGASIVGQPSETQGSVQLQWEYTDFVYPFQKDAEKVSLRASKFHSNDESTARKTIWNANQTPIRMELQKMLDHGWQPISEVGPASIRLEQVEDGGCLWIGATICVVWLIGAFIGLAWSLPMILFGGAIGYLLSGGEVRPIEVRIAMRKPLIAGSDD